jgi:hypothetical protein
MANANLTIDFLRSARYNFWNLAPINRSRMAGFQRREKFEANEVLEWI